MSDIAIIGGSVAGLASALALNQAGHEVRVLERDAAEPPPTVAEAHATWPRPTVPQVTHSHAFASLGVNLLLDRAPEIYRELVAEGADEIRLGERMPPSLTDTTPEPGDADLRMLGCRRSTFELVFRRMVASRPGIVFSPGVTVRGFELAPSGTPRVIGVRTGDGHLVKADVVIDATGRRSASAKWLAGAGVQVAQDKVEDCHISYYTRFYRFLGKQPPGPLNRGFGAGGLWDHYTAVLFLCDNATFSISIGVLPEDTQMKILRTEAAFTAAIRATPLLAPWIEPGMSEPISGVHAMGGLDNSLRGLAMTAQQPPVLGLFGVGDSVCTTNPAYGRGVSLALAHAYQIADGLAAYPSVSPAQSAEISRTTEQLMTPWWMDAVFNDRGRAGLWRATLHGAAPQQPPDGMVTFGAAAAAAATDPVVWRRLVRVMMSLAQPSTLYDDDEIRQRVRQALSTGHGPPMAAPGRGQFIEAVSAAA